VPVEVGLAVGVPAALALAVAVLEMGAALAMAAGVSVTRGEVPSVAVTSAVPVEVWLLLQAALEVSEAV
jgi:hypothetical protein